MSVAIDTVLVPVDGTAAASRAIEYAVAVADAYDADIHVVHLVDEDPRGASDTAPASVAADQKTFLTAATEDLQAVAEGGVGVTASAAAGFSAQSLSRNPVSVVLETASDVEADLIVVPRESDRENPAALLSKAAEHVLAHASQPVFSV